MYTVDIDINDFINSLSEIEKQSVIRNLNLNENPFYINTVADEIKMDHLKKVFKKYTIDELVKRLPE